MTTNNSGTVPPQSIDMEMSVLGALMVEGDTFFKVNDLLKPGIFYKTEHQLIFKTIEKIISDGETPDLLTVTHRLRKNEELEKVGGAYYLTELTNSVVNTSNVETYCRIIVEKFILREIIRISTTYEEKAYSESSDCFDLQSGMNSELQSITDFLMNNIENVPSGMVKKISEDMKKDHVNVIKYPHWKKLADIVTFKNGNVYLIGARPGHCKSVLSCNIARHLSKTDLVAIFSLEMTAQELAIRIISDISNITNKRLQNFQIFNDEQESLQYALIEFQDLKLVIIDKPKLSVLDIEIHSKKIIMKYGPIGLLIVDHFHLIKLNGRDKLQSYSDNSSDLKALAKRLECPLINLFQLNRDIDRRDNKRPKLSDLREVGEQDADVVIFLVRPELYGDMDQIGIVKVYVEKNRNGTTGEFDLVFDGNHQRLYDEDEEIEHKRIRNISESNFENESGF